MRRPENEDPSTITDAESRFVRNRYRRHNLVIKAVTTLAVIEVLYSGLYETPILIEESSLSGTKPRLEYIANALEHQDAMTVVMGGFGVRNSAPIAEALPQLDELGSVRAFDQDNRGIDIAVLANEVIQSAEKSDITDVNLFGDSASGITQVRIARYIQQDTSTNVRVGSIILDCTPPNVGTLRPDKRKDLETLSAASSIFPQLPNHPLVDYLYAQELIGNEPQPQAGSHYGIGTVLDKMNNPNMPSGALLSAEALQILHPSIGEDFKAIADIKTKRPPMIFTIRPKSDTADKVVISSLADHEITQMAKEAGLKHMSIKLPNIVHGDPTANPAEYREALKNIIVPALEKYNYPMVNTSLFY